MGQYWMPVNLDKKEFLDPHKLGCGLKLAEQVGTFPGTGTPLIILCAAVGELRSMGDLGRDEGTSDYEAIAARTIGRWRGDRIAIVGDYAEDEFLPPEFQASQIYSRCRHADDIPASEYYTDITEDVCQVLEHELGGAFSGDGWRNFNFHREQE
ncbi:MAG: hypothetical protein V3V08_07290 [Nannocystaceae bacterium]